MRQSGGKSDFQDEFWLLLWHRPFYDMVTETKANGEIRVSTI